MSKNNFNRDERTLLFQPKCFIGHTTPLPHKIQVVASSFPLEPVPCGVTLTYYARVKPGDSGKTFRLEQFRVRGHVMSLEQSSLSRAASV